MANLFMCVDGIILRSLVISFNWLFKLFYLFCNFHSRSLKILNNLQYRAFLQRKLFIKQTLFCKSLLFKRFAISSCSSFIVFALKYWSIKHRNILCNLQSLLYINHAMEIKNLKQTSKQTSNIFDESSTQLTKPTY